MGRLVRSRTKVQKPDGENVPPPSNIKRPRRVKAPVKNVDKIETNSAIYHKTILCKNVDKIQTNSAKHHKAIPGRNVDKIQTNSAIYHKTILCKNVDKIQTNSAENDEAIHGRNVDKIQTNSAKHHKAILGINVDKIQTDSAKHHKAILGKNVDKIQTNSAKHHKSILGKNVDKIQTNSAEKDKAIPGPSSVNADAEDKKPIYSSQKKSLTRKSLRGIEERLHLYDFEVDENEPVVKKSKRKPILKVKKHRTYKKKFKFLPETSIILEDVGKENVHPVSKAVTPSKKASFSVPLAEISNIPVEDNIDLSLDAAVQSKRFTLYSPPPYRSPKRDSNVPIVRTSDCNVTGNTSSRSLNVSMHSNKHEKSGCSTYSGSFINQLFIGSSTPIRSHWTEDSVPYVTPKPATQYGNFNLDNNFGLVGDEGIEEPLVSPIKSGQTPSHNISVKTPVKKSPVKVPFEQVVKILKFGAEAPEDSHGDLSFEGLPDNFYHDGDTPSFSSLPSTPEPHKKQRKERFTSACKVKHVQFLDESDDSGLTQSSEEKSTLNKCDIVYNNKRNTKKPKEDKDIGYETEDQVSTKRQVSSSDDSRRSYERPVYLRTKKKVTPYGIDTVEEDEQDHEETVSKKTTRKKNCGLSKKETLEMEKWAKAFNEQCMQVENFNLCVE